jgi:methylated-DNA-protein-cysteine methyltransferase related protein
VSTLDRLRRVIASVPRGKVITYGQVASAAGFPGAARLTVRALYAGEGLPWHRVVAAGGRIALEGEDGREQRLRLRIEGVKFHGGRVRMDLHGWVPRIPSRRGGRRGTRQRTPRRSASASSPRSRGPSNDYLSYKMEFVRE